MQRRTKRSGLCSSIFFVFTLTITTPLAQEYGWEAGGISAFILRLLGFFLVWSIILLCVLVPASVLVERLYVGAGRRVLAASFTGLIAVVPYLASILLREGWEILLLNIRALAAEPVLFFSEWLPFTAAGALFGWIRAPTAAKRSKAG